MGVERMRRTVNLKLTTSSSLHSSSTCRRETFQMDKGKCWTDRILSRKLQQKELEKSWKAAQQQPQGESLFFLKTLFTLFFLFPQRPCLVFALSASLCPVVYGHKISSPCLNTQRKNSNEDNESKKRAKRKSVYIVLQNSFEYRCGFYTKLSPVWIALLISQLRVWPFLSYQ